MKKLRLLVIPLMAIPFLASCSGGGNKGPKEWYEDTAYINSLTTDDITKENPDGTIGVVQTLMVNGLEHKVRLIGVNEDYKDKEKNKPIHTTWEFVDVISDSNGYSLVTQWNDTNDKNTANHNYLDSTIRKALNGTGGATHILWAEREATSWSTTYKSTVLDMLTKENSRLNKVLKAPYKTVMCKESSEWTPKEIKTGKQFDKLFLLSKEEIGGETEKTEAYTFYKEDEDLNEKRIKTQIKNDKIFTTRSKIKPSSLQTYTGEVNNYAGYVATSTAGSYSWLRSPTTDYDDFARYINYDGNIYGTHSVYNYAFAVAPAFCI